MLSGMECSELLRKVLDVIDVEILIKMSIARNNTMSNPTWRGWRQRGRAKRCSSVWSTMTLAARMGRASSWWLHDILRRPSRYAIPLLRCTPVSDDRIAPRIISRLLGRMRFTGWSFAECMRTMQHAAGAAYSCLGQE